MDSPFNFIFILNDLKLCQKQQVSQQSYARIKKGIPNPKADPTT